MILPEHDANRLLAEAGMPVVPMAIVKSPREAKREAGALGYPVALKLSSARHTHKSEIGGVALNLQNGGEVEKGFLRLDGLRERLDGDAKIILEPMAPEGAELFLGYQRHPQFGPVMSFGLGGIFLELTRDVAFRLLPARAADFEEMLEELGAWPRLKKGFRHLPPVGEGGVLRLMEQVADFALSRRDLRELDFNPVIARSEDVWLVDATIVLGGAGDP